MTIIEKVEKFLVETDWKKVGNFIKKTAISLQESVRKQQMKNLEKMENERDKNHDNFNNKRN